MNKHELTALAERPLVGAYKLGRCANGNEADKGRVIHAIRQHGWVALCGAEPGRRSAGWADHDDQVALLSQVNCRRCAAALRSQAQGEGK